MIASRGSFSGGSPGVLSGTRNVAWQRLSRHAEFANAFVELHDVSINAFPVWFRHPDHILGVQKSWDFTFFPARRFRHVDDDVGGMHVIQTPRNRPTGARDKKETKVRR